MIIAIIYLTVIQKLLELFHMKGLEKFEDVDQRKPKPVMAKPMPRVLQFGLAGPSLMAHESNCPSNWASDIEV